MNKNKKIFTAIVLTILLISTSFDNILAEQMYANDVNGFDPKIVNSDISTGINDIYEHRIGNLSIETVEYPIDNYDFFIYTEFQKEQFGNTKFLDITIPKITALSESGNLIKGVNVIFMAVTPQMNDYITETKQINKDNDKVTLTRKEVQKWADEKNEGEFPNKIWVLIQFNEAGFSDYDSDGNAIYWSEPVSSVIFHDDVVIRQKVLNEPTSTTNNGFNALMVDVSASLEKEHNPENIRLTSYIFLETSDIIISHNDELTYKPGDELSLNITIKNETKLANKLSIWLKTKGLELVDSEENPELVWGVFDSGLVANIVGSDGRFKNVMPGEELTFTQTFRITEEYDEDSILIQPALKAGYADYGWDFNEDEIIVIGENHQTEDETPVVPEETPVVPEETPAVPEETPEVPEETPAVPEETPVVPEETPVVPEETPIDSNEVLTVKPVEQNDDGEVTSQLPSTGMSNLALNSSINLVFIGMILNIIKKRK